MNARHKVPTCLSPTLCARKKKGHLANDADPLLLTLSLLSYMTGLTYELLRNPALFNVKQHFREMFKYFFAGLK
ncbi:MAG: hypothetical protein JKY67_15930 [Pseudomonadales bacterium]|nr:hypothetical protein [Pseudomonadales bacterium]